MELLIIAVFLLGLSAGGALMGIWLGPDPDLQGEWVPGDRPWWRP